jgi:hypothetical protein
MTFPKTETFPLHELNGRSGFFFITKPEGNWAAVFGWNLMVAGWLWAAWAGGAKTYRTAFTDGDSPIYTRGKIDVNYIPELDEPDDEPEKPRPTHLKLVP